MFWQVLFMALGLVFVIEGLLPFISPQHYRNFLSRVNKANSRSLRNLGLTTMIIGVVILFITHQFF